MSHKKSAKQNRNMKFLVLRRQPV